MAILIVDDDEDVCTSFQQTLEELLAVRVHVAHSSEAALEILQKTPVDVILSDYLLPGANGAWFLGEAARICPEARLIAITGHPDPYLLGKGKEHFFVLSKPVDPAVLVELVAGRRASPAA